MYHLSSKMVVDENSSIYNLHVDGETCCILFAGKGDETCCFSCGSVMQNWSWTEDVWIRHARTAPTCQLLLREKDADWVTNAIAQHGLFKEPEPEPTITVVYRVMSGSKVQGPLQASRM